MIAKLRLLKPYNLLDAGELIELPQAIASLLIQRGVAVEHVEKVVPKKIETAPNKSMIGRKMSSK